MRRTLALLAGLAATAVIVAAPTHADPQSDYLNALAGQGFELTAANTRRLVNFGNIACDDIRNGGEDLAFRHLDSFPGTDPARVQVVVSTAHAKLCPGA
ncbi:MAG: DUF732 domain-containing protein [Mycobacterium sp.]